MLSGMRVLSTTGGGAGAVEGKAVEVFHNPDFPDEIAVRHTPGLDTRNVIDHYKYWEQAAIVEDLAATAFPVDVVAENFAYDFNIATLVRNSNAFNMASVNIVGRRQWDKRGAVGTHKYTPVFHHEDAEAYYRSLVEAGVPIIVMDNVAGAVPLPAFEWPQGRIAVVFGQEAIGVSNLALSYQTHVVEVPQRGSVRSLNVGATSGIVLYDYMAKMSA